MKILRGKRDEQDLDELSKFFSDIGVDVDDVKSSKTEFDFPDFELGESP